MSFRVVVTCVFCSVAMLIAIELAQTGDVFGAPKSSSTNFIPLPEDFDNQFRFLNPNDLRGKILFTATIDNFDRILMLDLDKRRVVKVIDGPGNNSFASWSPNGKGLVFVSDRDGNKEIYIADGTGKNEARITTNKVADDHPSWSRDGKQLLFFSETGKGGSSLKTNLFSYDISTQKLAQLTTYSGKNSTPQLSPNGDTIAFTTNRFWPGWDVCLYNQSSKKESCPLSGTSTFCRPRWSRDGTMLAYSGGFAGVDGYAFLLLSQKSVAIAKTSGDDYDLEWSSDDSSIVFASDAEESKRYNLYSAKVQLSDKSPAPPTTLLTSRYSLRYPSWWQSK